MPIADLRGRTVLIVENEAIIGLELKFVVEDAGGVAVGPVPTAAQALRVLDSSFIDVAILDLCLDDGTVAPVIERLGSAGVPIVICTGHDLDPGMRDQYPGIPVYQKPTDAEVLVLRAAQLIGAMR